MNQIEEREIIKEAKRNFSKHQWLCVSVKKEASVPYEKSIFHKIISDSKKPLNHKNYLLYIHDDYLTISSKDFLFEPVKIQLHDELWIEIYFVFYIKQNQNQHIHHLKDNTDNEPI